jgi:hypothetical protein
MNNEVPEIKKAFRYFKERRIEQTRVVFFENSPAPPNQNISDPSLVLEVQNIRPRRGRRGNAENIDATNRESPGVQS